MIKALLLRNILWLPILWLAWSCLPDDEAFNSDPSLRLTYSTDTVNFDTIVSGIESTTLRFRVYNPHRNALKIDNIRLGNSNSVFRLTINGIEGKTFANVPIIGGDSLLVLLKVTLPNTNVDSVYEVREIINFIYNDFDDRVNVVAWGLDVAQLSGEVLACNTEWNAGKPYLINDFVLVDSLCTLTVRAGAQVLMGNGAAIFVKGRLKIEGTAENPVTIRNIRTDRAFANAPGQWDAIYFLEGSSDNIIDHTIIKNGTIGLRIGAPDEDDDYDLVVSHSIIQNMSMAGILAFTSDVYAYNVQINNCRSYLVGNFIGGNYTYEHCTFSNFPTDFFRQEPSVQLSDVIFLEGGQSLTAPLNVRMINSIVWGNEREELLISNAGQQAISLDLRSNIIRSLDNRWVSAGNIISQERNFPRFAAPIAANFRIDSLSPARDKGLPIGIPFDLLKNKRDELPDIGAFEWLPKKK